LKKTEVTAVASCVLDVLCVGHASFDQVFSVPHHPLPDEKLFAEGLVLCGGGPAANAAVMVQRLGFQAGFCGYLGADVFGDAHAAELTAAGVDIRGLVRGTWPTPLSTVLVKPDGARSLVNFKGETKPLEIQAVDVSDLEARVYLFDGHEPELSTAFCSRSAPKVLDAGSLHTGTERLMHQVEHLVASEKFAREWLGREDPMKALEALSKVAPVVVITLGEKGLIWQRGQESGALKAPSAAAVDTTGAGDAFHGAYAAGLSAGWPFPKILEIASHAGAACCEVLGARPGLPDRARLASILP
jgi:sulfofructose kinase